MQESLYVKIKNRLCQTEPFRQRKEYFLREMERHPVGIAAKRPTLEELEKIAKGSIRQLLEQENPYLMFLISLAALDEAADELKSRIGYPGYTDEVYLPIGLEGTGGKKAGGRYGELSWEEILEKGVTKEAARQNLRDAFGLAESYEVETMLEEEINRMAEENIYQKVYVAGKLELEPVLYQFHEENEKASAVKRCMNVIKTV